MIEHDHDHGVVGVAAGVDGMASSALHLLLVWLFGARKHQVELIEVLI